MEVKPAILARTGAACQIPHWKTELAAAYKRPRELLGDLGIDSAELMDVRAAAKDFRMLVPRSYAALMERGNPRDPLLLQVLPAGEELAEQPGFSSDPLRERAAAMAPGLLQKYRGRALLIATGACALHCRYCFRRHFSYASDTITADRGAAAMAMIGADPDIAEVILSGGDPLVLDDAELARLTKALAGIPHVQRLRLHTRVPVVLPSRVTAELCRLLTASRLQAVAVMHVNHPRELGIAAREALARMRNAGIRLLNQSVLLRAVNDDAQVLATLSETLFAEGVLPYYLHMLDRVRGAAHFAVSRDQAIALLERLRAHLPGYLVPRLVREEAGAANKITVC